MEPRRFVPKPLEVLVVVAGLLVAAYAVYVVRSVSAGTGVESQPLPRPTASVSPTASATPEPTTPARIGPFRRAAARSTTLLVVGDGSGDDPGEWVDLLAQDLGAGRQVTLHGWDDATGAFAAPVVYGTGKPLDVWNLSYPGTTPAYAARLDDVTATPGAVVLSVGHDRDARSVNRVLTATRRAITATWDDLPTALVLQDPSTGRARKQQAQAVDAVRARAVRDRLPVIDVRSVFAGADSPGALLADASNPSAAGSRLWADTVGSALGLARPATG